MAAEDVQAFAGVDVPELRKRSSGKRRRLLGDRDRLAPQKALAKRIEHANDTHPARRIVAPADRLVPADVDGPDAHRMSRKDMHRLAPVDVPDADGTITRARDGDRATVEDAEAADGRGVAGEGVDAESASR